MCTESDELTSPSLNLVVEWIISLGGSINIGCEQPNILWGTYNKKSKLLMLIFRRFVDKMIQYEAIDSYSRKLQRNDHAVKGDERIFTEYEY